jgi:hypothetical protein
MFSKSYQVFYHKVKSLYLCGMWASILLMLVFCSSCSPSKPPEVNLTINLVSQAGGPGVYHISGSTNLPAQSQITVAAVRYLLPPDQQSLNSQPNSIYSILDRQIVDVTQGKWQTNLKLWQVAPDGRFQEAWQLKESQAGTIFKPADGVTFIATFDPASQNRVPEKPEMQPLQGKLVRFTSEGQEYIQSSQTLQIGLPTGRTTPSFLQAEDLNGGWGNRSELTPEPLGSGIVSSQPVKKPQTTAPLSPPEILR